VKSTLTMGLDPGSRLHYNVLQVSGSVCLTLNKGDMDVVYYIDNIEDILTVMKAANDLSDAWKALNEPTVVIPQQP